MIAIHDQTKRELIESGTGVIGSLLKELLVHRNQMARIEQEKEMDLEIAKARRQAASSNQSTEATSSTHKQQVGEPDLSAAFEDLKAREDCSICRTLLEAIEQAESDVQVRALTEYGRLKHAVDSGASEDEIKQILTSSDTLEDLLEQEMGASAR